MHTPCYRVVIADDQQEFRLWLRGLLERSGRFQVVGEARDGREALAAAKALRPDLMIVDVEMPGMTGIEVARRVTGALPQVRVIAVSIHAEREYGALARQAGAAAFIPKDSLSLDSLRQTLSGEG